MRLSVLREELSDYMATRQKLVPQSRKPQMYRTDRDHETPKICATPGHYELIGVGVVTAKKVVIRKEPVDG